MKNLTNFLKYILPWIITFLALFLAFEGLDWDKAWEYIKSAKPHFVIFAILLTVLSYLIRSFRWVQLFPNKNISVGDSTKITFFGFFMNNLLPAKAGEIARAHAGSKVTGEKRTTVLATIATERLADGITISLLFLAFLGTKNLGSTSSALYWVALLFFVAGLLVFLVIFKKNSIFKILRKISERFKNKYLLYILDRLELFIEGISPVGTRKRAPILFLWSLAVWATEICVYIAILYAFGVEFNFSRTALFMVAVNFSSLIPAAPGGIGVIEAVTSKVLIEDGVFQEIALPMVITQHIIQYLVVGIPGIWIFIRNQKKFLKLRSVKV